MRAGCEFCGIAFFHFNYYSYTPSLQSAVVPAIFSNSNLHYPLDPTPYFLDARTDSPTPQFEESHKMGSEGIAWYGGLFRALDIVVQRC